MLKITKSVQPIEVKTLVTVIYAPPGVGKTSMAFTAEKPLLLDFDKGSYRAKNRRDVVLVDRWADVTDIKAEDLADYKTLVVDTAGRALDALAVDIIRDNPKMGRGGALTLQGYGELRARFTAWCSLVRSFGLDVVLLAHADEQRKGDEVIERLDVQGGSKNEIYKSADVMGRISIVNRARILNLSPTDTAFGKNPGGLPPLEVPDYATATDFLAGVIAKTKEALNTLTGEQAKAAAEMAAWKERIDAMATVEDLNGLIEPIKAANEAIRENVKRLLVKTAKEKGFTYDKDAGAFVAPAPVERVPGADDVDPPKAARKGSKAA
ncbi:MAG TPA: ATP-binding protein [Rhodothermales bacterium]|nr:ATP-binding protein [Rhodothermales bacterium]